MPTPESRRVFVMYGCVVVFAAAFSCATVQKEKPCDGVYDSRYSCRAVPDRQPNPVRADGVVVRRAACHA